MEYFIREAKRKKRNSIMFDYQIEDNSHIYKTGVFNSRLSDKELIEFFNKPSNDHISLNNTKIIRDSQ